MLDMKRFFAAGFSVFLFASILLGSGCHWKGDWIGGDDEPTTQPAEAWNSAPVAIRIYPATRFVSEDDRTLLEARLELLDALEDSTKSVGTVRFELRGASSGNKTSITDRLYAWDVSIRTLEDQKRYYDPVTRTYLFRLSLDDLTQLPGKVNLHVQYTPDSGNRIEADATLNVPKTFN